MTNSTPTYWSVDGESLQTYAYNIQTWGGDAQGVPPLRGDDVTVPFAEGELWQEKVPGARTISFNMWVVGANPDGSLPTEGSSRELFERNWRKLRALFWNPRKQITLTKRFKDWNTGQIVSASAKAQFASGLQPTMNGTQRAQFTVQLKLTDPFFYGDVEESIDISAYEPTHTNRAKNPTPMKDLTGWGGVEQAYVSKAVGLRRQLANPTPVFVPGVGWAVPSTPSVYQDAEDSHSVRVSYSTEIVDGIGGVTYGRPNVTDISAVEGESRRYSMRVLLTNRPNRMRLKVEFYDIDGVPVGAPVYGVSTNVPKSISPIANTVAASQWTKLKTYPITTPAGAVRVRVSAQSAPDGTEWRPSRTNYALDPSFETGSALTEVARNLFNNPQFINAPTTFATTPIYTNRILDPEIKMTSTEIEVVKNYLGNPDFETNGITGWTRTLEYGSYGTASFGASTVQPRSGSTCLQSSTTGANEHSIKAKTGVTPAGPMRFSVYLRGTGEVVHRLLVKEFSSTNVLLNTTTVPITVTSSWARYGVSFTNMSATSYNEVTVEYSSSAVATSLFIDDAQVEQGGTDTEPIGSKTASDGFYVYKKDPKIYQTVTVGTSKVNLQAWVKFVKLPKVSLAINTSNLVGQANGVGMAARGLTNNICIERTESNTSASMGTTIYRVDASEVGKPLTVVALCYVPPTYSATSDSALGSNVLSRGIYVADAPTVGQAQAPATSGLHVVRATITPTAAGQTIRLGGGGAANGQRIYWGLPTVVQGVYLGPPFSGGTTKWDDTDTFALQGYKAGWTGTVNASTSAMYPKVPTKITPHSSRGVVPVQTQKWGYAGSTRALRLVRLGTPYEAGQGVSLGTFQAGRYRVSAVLRIPDDYNASQDLSTGVIKSRSIVMPAGTYPKSVQGPSTPGTHVVSDVFNLTQAGEFRLSGGGTEGQYLDWGIVTVVKLPNEAHTTDIVKAPFSGTSSAPDLTFSWAGTANDSNSIVRANIATAVDDGYSEGNPTYGVRSSLWADNGSYSLRAITTSGDANNSTVWLDTGWLPKASGTYTMLVKVRIPNTLTGTPSANPLSFKAASGWSNPRSPSLPATAGVHELRWTFDIGYISSWFNFGFEIGYPDAEVFIDSMLITRAPYAGGYFDGSTGGKAEWVGTPNNSVSQIQPDVLYANKVAAVDSESQFDYFSGREKDSAVSGYTPELYSWMGEAYASESVMYEPKTVPDIFDIKGDYITHDIKIEVQQGVSGFTTVNETDGEEYTLTYGRGSYEQPSVIDVKRFAATSGGKSTSAYIDSSGGKYWFTLHPGTNAILTSGVGLGKIIVKYRPAWL